MLPRRHFATASSNTTDDIVRTRDAFNTKLIDNNDVAGAEVVREIINTQDTIEAQVNTNSGILETIGSLEDFISTFNESK